MHNISRSLKPASFLRPGRQANELEDQHLSGYLDIERLSRFARAVMTLVDWKGVIARHGGKSKS